MIVLPHWVIPRIQQGKCLVYGSFSVAAAVADGSTMRRCLSPCLLIPCSTQLLSSFFPIQLTSWSFPAIYCPVVFKLHFETYANDVNLCKIYLVGEKKNLQFSKMLHIYLLLIKQKVINFLFSFLYWFSSYYAYI